MIDTLDSRQRHIFISYVSENQDFASELADSLQSAGHRVWLATDKLLPGQLWQEQIPTAIENGMGFVACFSREYLQRQSTIMNSELNLAIEQIQRRPRNRAWFIPLRLDASPIPNWRVSASMSFADFHYLDCSDGLAPDKVRKITMALSGL